MTAYEDLVVEIDEPVAIIKLNRPDRLNAFRSTTMRELRAAVTEAAADERVVGIILTGTGRGFCAGLDSSDLSSAVDAPPRSAGEGTKENEAPALFSYLLNVPKPVIAAVNGTCAGGGFVLAMMSDLRFASEDAAFHTVFSKRGLTAEHGTSWLLPRMVGLGPALDLLWSSRRVDAAEAMAIGFVDRVFPPEELLPAAVTYIRQLAETVSPASIASIKELVHRHLGLPWPAAAVEADLAMQESVAGDDFREGIAAFLDKRPPRFPRIGAPDLAPTEKEGAS